MPTSSLGVLAAAAVAKAQVYRHGTVDTEVFASLTSGVDALVRAFARGLRSFSRKTRPVVLILDTCELLGDANDWLLEVIRLAGSRTGWVLGARLAPQSEAAPGGVITRLHTVAHRDRMITLPLGAFDEHVVADYLGGVYGECLPEGVTAAEILRMTRGIPLAISFIAPALREGLSPEKLFGPSPDGTASQLFRSLVLRYLKHIRASQERACPFTGSQRDCDYQR